MLEVTITGRLGRDAEVRTIGGKDYDSFSIPVQKGKDGPTLWVKVLARVNGDNKVKDYLLKGAGVFVRGDLSVSTYTDKRGVATVDVTVWANRIEITKFVEAESAPAVNVAAEDNDDLPFD